MVVCYFMHIFFLFVTGFTCGRLWAPTRSRTHFLSSSANPLTSMAKLARFRSLLTILLSMCYCVLPVWITAGVTRCRISSFAVKRAECHDGSEVLREQAAHPESGLGCPGNSRRLLSIRQSKR